MNRLEYKGRMIDIFTARNGRVWTWAFTVDGVRAGINKCPECCGTLDLAVEKAKEAAYELIDQGLHRR
jgi:hypothetical protein